MEIKDHFELGGFEEQVREGNIKLTEVTDQTMWDLSNLIEQLELRREQGQANGNWVVVTGYSGYWRMRLRLAFDKFGRSKLPRKMKKMYFGSAKTRRRLFPEYYKKPVYIKESNYNFNI